MCRASLFLSQCSCNLFFADLEYGTDLFRGKPCCAHLSDTLGPAFSSAFNSAFSSTLSSTFGPTFSPAKSQTLRYGFCLSVFNTIPIIIIPYHFV